MRGKLIWLGLAFLLASRPATAVPAEGAGRFFPPKDLMRIGVFYYPEHWPRSQWERDFKAMARLGFEFTHFGEFAWSFLEPQEGVFEFAWLDRAIELAAREGLKIILCTPTPCPPAWMGEKHPEIYLMGWDGRRESHGTRGNASLSNPRYLGFVERIVTQLAQRYGKDPRIMGWQVDNEPPAMPDYSPAARQAFQSWLRERYGSVAALNEAWGGSFWSFRYDRFDQVLIPRSPGENEDSTSPHALLDFQRFTSDTQAAFIDRQAEILKRFIRPDQWVTTNYTNVTYGADPRRTRRLDFPSFTFYPVAGSNLLGGQTFRNGNPYRMAEACDFYRPIRGITGVMELQPGQVNWAPINPQPAPGAVAMWIWHAFGGGASFVSTYRFRHPLYGSELYHEGIVGTDGVSVTRGGAEFVQAMRELRRLRRMAHPDAALPAVLAARKTGFLWSHDVMWDLEIHRQTAQWSTWRHRNACNAAVKSTGAPVDFIAVDDDFSSYPFLVAPAFQLVDDDLVKKWRSYVENGGHLVLTCRSGQKDMRGQLPEAPWADSIAGLIGARIDGFDVLPEGVSGTVACGDQSFRWSCWGDWLVPAPGTKVLATYGDQFYAGTAAAVTRRLGRGSVTYIGVVSQDGRLERQLLREVYRRAGIDILDLPAGVYISWRDGFFVGVNYSDQAVALPMAANAVIHVGESPLRPAQAVIWTEPSPPPSHPMK